jgi:hypothetical protein
VKGNMRARYQHVALQPARRVCSAAPRERVQYNLAQRALELQEPDPDSGACAALAQYNAEPERLGNLALRPASAQWRMSQAWLKCRDASSSGGHLRRI